MKTREQKLWAVAIVTVSLFLTTCRKEIAVPTPNLEKLFGTWEWVRSSNGIGGQTTVTGTSGYSQTIEFNKNGICQWHIDGVKQNKRKFTLTEGSSIHTSGTAYLIKYKDTKLFNKKKYNMQSVVFCSLDTLVLNEESYDWFLYTYVYVRQK